jgi:hypothetical protein
MVGLLIEKAAYYRTDLPGISSPQVSEIRMFGIYETPGSKDFLLAV